MGRSHFGALSPARRASQVPLDVFLLHPIHSDFESLHLGIGPGPSGPPNGAFLLRFLLAAAPEPAPGHLGPQMVAIWAATSIQSHNHTFIHSNIHAFIHSHIHTSTHPHMQTFIHELISDIHTYIHTHTHTYIQTYRHTKIQALSLVRTHAVPHTAKHTRCIYRCTTIH